MSTTKVFISGNSQAVRLPRAMRFKTKVVVIRKVGDSVILTEPEHDWADIFTKLQGISDDFMREREDLPPQEREKL